VKTTIFLKTMDDFAKVTGIYAEKFVHDPPARETVQAAKLPKGGLVEISAIAVI
jgi:2-iminobutanoate/2-iminopropanoate deaminase